MQKYNMKIFLQSLFYKSIAFLMNKILGKNLNSVNLNLQLIFPIMFILLSYKNYVCNINLFKCLLENVF